MTTGRDDGHLRYLLSAYLFGNLSDDGRAEVESHLAACAACRAELAELGETRALVEEALAVPGAGGADGAASEDAPAAPYSFEAHRLERVLAAGKRGALFGSRIGWYSAAAMVVVALVAALVLPNLSTARRGARHIPNLAQSAPPMSDVDVRSEGLLEGFQGGASGSELTSGGSGGGASAYGYRGDVAPPPASTPAPASPVPDPAQAEWKSNDQQDQTVLIDSVVKVRGLDNANLGVPASERPLARSDLFGNVPAADGWSLGIAYDGGDVKEDVALEDNAALGEARKSPGAGGKLDADDARHGRDRAAAAAPAPKPAAPAEEVAKKAELEKSVRSGELDRDRSEIAMKRVLEVPRDQIEVDGTLPPTDSERQKSKERGFYGFAADEAKDAESLEVLDLAGESKNEEVAESRGRLSARSAGLTQQRRPEPAGIAPPGDPAVAPSARERTETATLMTQGTAESPVHGYAFRENKSREELAGLLGHTQGQWAGYDSLRAGSQLELPPIGANSGIPGADKNPAGIYAYGEGQDAAEDRQQYLKEAEQLLQGRRESHLRTPVVEEPMAFNVVGDHINPLGLRGTTLIFDGDLGSSGGLTPAGPTQIPALNLLHSLQEQTGLIVNLPSSAAEPAFDNPVTIDILGENIALDPPMVAAILATNGYEIRRERLQDGSDVLNVLPRDARTPAGTDDPTLAFQANPAIQQALLAAATEQAPQLGLRFAPTPLDPATQKAGLVLRAPLATLEQVQRAVEFAESGAVSPDPTALAGWFSGVLAGTIAPLPGSDLAQRAESRADEERTLRAYDHYKQNDPSLDHRTFAARRLPVPAPVIGDEGLGQEGFRARYGVNPFVETERDRFSTFAMDVDTASYTRARTMISEGRLPDPAAVRTEEFVNAFPDPRAADPSRAFSVFCEGGPSPFGLAAGRETARDAGRDAVREASADAPLVEQVQITVKARDLAPGERRPAILTFAIDTSGSMQDGERLDLVRSALAVLLDGLAPDDRVGIVAYGTQAYLVLPHTPARERERIAGALESLTCHGSTNVEAGLDLAYRLADEVAHARAANRVIVCSDGVATSGERDSAALLRKVRVYADRGVYLSVVGFGAGRYDDAFLERIANQGNGQYGYVNSVDDAVRLFADNLPAALSVLARDAKIQVDFDPAVVRQYRLLGYENRDVKDEDFRNDKIDAGEVGPGSTVTAIYEVVRRPASAGDLGRVHLRYHDTSLGRVEEIDFPIPPGVVATRLEGTSERFRLLASVAEVAELLRGSYFARDGAFSAVLGALATLSPATVARPEVHEFIDMSLRARDLSLEQWAKE